MPHSNSRRRLAALEEQREAEDLRRLESLSDAELEALCADTPPEVTAAIQALSDRDLERARRGHLSEVDILRMYEVRRAPQ